MLLQQLINGIALGSTYALIALGYTMVYGIIALINFAHGEIFMAGAFVGLLMVALFKMNIFVAMILAMVTCMVMGVVIELIAYRPLRKSSRLSALISAIGVSIFLSTLALMIFGADAKGFPDTAFPVHQVKILGAEIRPSSSSSSAFRPFSCSASSSSSRRPRSARPCAPPPRITAQRPSWGST